MLRGAAEDVAPKTAMTAYLYPLSLLLISVFVAALEYFFPKREQRQLRPDLWSDFVHLVFNGHFLGVVLFGLATNFVLPHLDAWLTSVGLIDKVYRNAAAPWPLWVQVVVALVVIDFVQWAVHNLLHRVPFLWEMHKTHHSVKDGEMDWIVSFRFQWTEVVVYKSILYLPLAYFGFHPTAVLVHAIFGTLIGHLNHANIDWDWGPLKYVLNSPNMHIWHHDFEGDTHTTVNFGIIFSTWDWIFGTAKMPPKDPAHLGFPGVEAFPRNFFSQALWPVQQLIPALLRRPVLSGVFGALLVGGGYAAATVSGPTVATPMFGEVAAASQPAQASAPEQAYAPNPQAATLALARFGDDAREAGMARPEFMVSVRELAAALGAPQLVLLDVRPPERFAAGHIPTARQLYRSDYSLAGAVPGLSKNAADLGALLRNVGVRTDSVVVAYTDGGPEAYRLWWTLREVAGFEIKVLDGGLQRWKQEGHGIAAGSGLPATPGDVALHAAPRAPSLWSDIAQFVESKPGAVLVDTRSRDEYDGKEHNEKAARPGRIPGAKHLDWYSVFRGEDDYRMSPASSLDGLFASVGVTPDTPVVTYCQSGTRSASIFFALLQLGHDETKLLNYDGSWAEYSRLDLAVEP